MTDFTWGTVWECLERAKADFLKRDSYLLKVNANERSMTHKFAEYLQRQLPTMDVDCEYNRVGDVPKRLKQRSESKVRQDDEHATTVFPDIIVHRRGTVANILILEAKKCGSDPSEDLEKLEAFMRDANYRYHFAARLTFITVGPPDVKIERICPRIS